MGKNEKAKNVEGVAEKKREEKGKQESKGVKKDGKGVKLQGNQEAKKQECKGVSKCCLTVTSLFILSLGSLSYKIHEFVSYVPEMPYLPVDEWWGPNNTRQMPDWSVRPFRIVFTDAMEADIRVRFENFRQLTRPKTFEGAGWTYGVNSEEFDRFFEHWLFKYDFRKQQKFLNKFEHFKTNIQGLDIHFMHVKPKVDKNVMVLPLLLLHGWPGSIREFYEVIPLLTTPRPGYDFVFEIIAPSLPGYGYSQAPVRRGLSTGKVAIIMRNLMRRLGFKQYYIQGGDMGHNVGSSMATIFSEEVLGFHTNMAASLTKVPTLIWILGGICSAFEKLVEWDFTDRLYPLKEKLELYIEESGYMHMHLTKPDTLGIALQESPVGLAGYILEKFVVGTSREGKFQEDGGIRNVFSKDALLDNIMIYWSTGSITSSMRLYTEKLNNADMENAIRTIPTEVPTWALRLKYEIFFTPTWLFKWKYPKLLGTTTLDEGGHFAALEKPTIFADDVFKAVKQFQEFNIK